MVYPALTQNFKRGLITGDFGAEAAPASIPKYEVDEDIMAPPSTDDE
jgi:hypothetical protein